MKTILVTGGAGFIGSHVVEHFLSRGHTVVVIDDLSSGRLDNLPESKSSPQLDVVVGSVLDQRLLDPLVRRADQVIHLGSPVGVRLLAKDPVHVTDETVSGTAAILRTCAAYEKPVFIASSSEVYGKSQDLPFHEDQDIVLGPPNRRRWSYGAAKLVGELLGQAYAQQYLLPVVIGRIFNTAGPRQSGAFGMVVPRFAAQALRNEPITVYGDGTQLRCFCHVSDTASAIVKLMETPEAHGEIINIGSDKTVSVADLAYKVRQLAESQSDVVRIPFETAYGPDFDDMQARQPDLSKIRALIGFDPERELTTIITDVIDSIRSTAYAPPFERVEEQP